jgi:hypothetical protein
LPNALNGKAGGALDCELSQERHTNAELRSQLDAERKERDHLVALLKDAKKKQAAETANVLAREGERSKVEQEVIQRLKDVHVLAIQQAKEETSKLEMDLRALREKHVQATDRLGKGKDDAECRLQAAEKLAKDREQQHVLAIQQAKEETRLGCERKATLKLELDLRALEEKHVVSMTNLRKEKGDAELRLEEAERLAKEQLLQAAKDQTGEMDTLVALHRGEIKLMEDVRKQSEVRIFIDISKGLEFLIRLPDHPEARLPSTLHAVSKKPPKD